LWKYGSYSASFATLIARAARIVVIWTRSLWRYGHVAALSPDVLLKTNLQPARTSITSVVHAAKPYDSTHFFSSPLAPFERRSNAEADDLKLAQHRPEKSAS
jgi:hypothetical protein